MNVIVILFIFVLVLVVVFFVMVQVIQLYVYYFVVVVFVDVDVLVIVEVVVVVVECFNRVLFSGDLVMVEVLFVVDVFIFEFGGVECSCEEYLGYYVVSDVVFFKGVYCQLFCQCVCIVGEFVWVGIESELYVQKDGKLLIVQSIEIMVLKQIIDGWWIVYIYWFLWIKC